MTDSKIIDTLCYIPTHEVLMDLICGLPQQMSRYLKDIFGGNLAKTLNMDAAELYRMKTTLTPHQLEKKLEPHVESAAISVEEFIDDLKSMNVEKGVIFNLDEETPSGLKGLPNDYYAEIVNKYPDIFTGFAGIDPLKGMEAIREIRRSYEMGLRGVAVRPFMFNLKPTAAKMYPIYSTCVELNIPIWFHLSINYSSNSMIVEKPIYLDKVAEDFPDLKMIAGHGGWPWVMEMMAVAWKNPNIYIDIASYLPKYLMMPGGGWEPLLQYGNSILQNRILFGSTWLFMGKTIKEMADGIKTLPLKESVKQKWLHDNAAALLNA